MCSDRPRSRSSSIRRRRTPPTDRRRGGCWGLWQSSPSATERLRGVRPAVSACSAARASSPDHPYYAKAERSRGCLSDAGFAVISGGGPGLMEAANRGAFAGKSPAIGLNILLPHEKCGNRLSGRQLRLPLFLRAQDDVRALRVRLCRAAGRLRHARRAVRVPHAGADRQEPAHSDHPRRRRVLARARRLDARQAGRRRHDRRRTTST